VFFQIFAGAFPENYEPPSGFYFEVNDDSQIVQVSYINLLILPSHNYFFCFVVLNFDLFLLKDNMDLFDYNVQDRVNDFVAAALSQVS
jgi:alpha-mannosidase